MTAAGHPDFRSGFACFVGRPNVGKSTLTNALVGSKVAIMSDRPQTTRHAVRGIVNRPDAQLVVVDTPGFHKPRTLLGQRLNDVVLTTLAEVDVIGFCVAGAFMVLENVPGMVAGFVLIGLGAVAGGIMHMAGMGSVPKGAASPVAAAKARPQES